MGNSDGVWSITQVGTTPSKSLRTLAKKNQNFGVPKSSLTYPADSTGGSRNNLTRGSVNTDSDRGIAIKIVGKVPYPGPVEREIQSIAGVGCR
jgi:hypothetical protein